MRPPPSPLLVRRALPAAALLSAVALGCGGAGASTETHSAPNAAPVGNEAVAARIATVPPPPIPWDTQFGAITRDQAVAICPWVETHVNTTEVNEDCPNGGHVHIGAGCEVDPLMQMVAQMAQVQCSLNVAEYMACNLAMRAEPCASGPFGANLAECQAMTTCIGRAFAAAQPTE